MKFGRYELLLKLGAGGMATLYLARIRGPQDFERRVAIKKIHDHLTEQKQFVDMFLDEAKISARIHHQNVVQIQELGEIQGVYFISMEFVHGQDLSRLLRKVGTGHEAFRWEHAARIVADAAAGLHAAHELTDSEGSSLGLVHRDVSPQNILVSYDGFIKVADFGIAYAAQRITQTRAGMLKGKLAYMSPEQAQDEPIDRRTDVFALGIVLFEATCLKRLFREETDSATFRRVSAADVPRPRSIRPDLPENLEAILLKALALDPAQRYQTAAELQEALEELLIRHGRVIGSTRIAKLMDALYGAEKTSLDQKIADASKDAPVNDDVYQPLTAEIDDAPTTAGEAPSQMMADSASVRPRSRATVVGALVASGILLIAGIAVYLAITLRVDRKAARTNRDEYRAPAMSTATMTVPSSSVELTFFITPKQALLFLDGRKHQAGTGSSKRIIRVKRGETPIEIWVSADGYSTAVSKVLPIQDQSIPINLLQDRTRVTGPPQDVTGQQPSSGRTRRRGMSGKSLRRKSPRTLTIRSRQPPMGAMDAVMSTAMRPGPEVRSGVAADDIDPD